ncbi:universal stress protein [Halomonas shantousis]
MYTSLLVPIDGSETAKKALKVASQLARPSNAKLYLLHVSETLPASDVVGLGVGAAPFVGSPEDEEKAGRKLLDEAAHAVGLDGLEVHHLTRQGPPARIIVEEADRLGVDAIVMGSRGLSDLKGLAVGSVSHKVNHIAGCTVITVH